MHKTRHYTAADAGSNSAAVATRKKKSGVSFRNHIHRKLVAERIPHHLIPTWLADYKVDRTDAIADIRSCAWAAGLAAGMTETGAVQAAERTAGGMLAAAAVAVAEAEGWKRDKGINLVERICDQP